MYNENINLLPDAYYKGKNGNNFKLLSLNEQCAEALFNDINEVGDIDLETATGKTLDLLGDTVGQLRGKLDDDQFRLMIQNKIGRNLCQGDYNSVVELITQMLGLNTGEVVLRDSDEPCRVTIDTIPLERLVEKGFTAEQATVIIEQLLPVCVRLANAEFEGTFEFGEEEITYEMLENKTYSELEEHTYEDLENAEIDLDAGFADEEQTIGGYLGFIKDDDTNDFKLPL